MRIIDSSKNELEISEANWILAADLFAKWGYVPEEGTVNVKDVEDIYPELSAWGIPWKRTKWI